MTVFGCRVSSLYTQLRLALRTRARRWHALTISMHTVAPKCELAPQSTRTFLLTVSIQHCCSEQRACLTANSELQALSRQRPRCANHEIQVLSLGESHLLECAEGRQDRCVSTHCNAVGPFGRRETQRIRASINSPLQRVVPTSIGRGQELANLQFVIPTLKRTLPIIPSPINRSTCQQLVVSAWTTCSVISRTSHPVRKGTPQRLDTKRRAWKLVLRQVKHPTIPSRVACRKSSRESLTICCLDLRPGISHKLHHPRCKTRQSRRKLITHWHPQSAKVTRDKELTIQEENILEP